MAKKGRGPAHPFGFAEERQAPLTPQASFRETAHDTVGGRLIIGPGGRVVIPADLRQAMGVDEGDTLLARFVDGELRILSTASAVMRAQALVRASIPAGGGSVVDELLADRRREVQLERERDR